MYKLALSLHSSSKVRLKPALEAAWAAVSRSPSSWWSTVAPACVGMSYILKKVWPLWPTWRRRATILVNPPPAASWSAVRPVRSRTLLSQPRSSSAATVAVWREKVIRFDGLVQRGFNWSDLVSSALLPKPNSTVTPESYIDVPNCRPNRWNVKMCCFK